MINALIAYESQTGNTRRAAETIAETVRGMGGEAVVKRVADVKPVDVQAASAVFVGTWVHGYILFGVRPAGAQKWVPMLPPLDGKPVGAFCTYAFHPHRALQTFAALLEKRGAIIRAQRAFHRRNLSKGVEEFVRAVVG